MGLVSGSNLPDKIFLLFQRLHSRKLNTGAGIDVALCQNIAINHGGEIYAGAIEKEGTSFHIYPFGTEAGATVNN